MNRSESYGNGFRAGASIALLFITMFQVETWSWWTVVCVTLAWPCLAYGALGHYRLACEADQKEQ